jgi:hypothetical protein
VSTGSHPGRRIRAPDRHHSLIVTQPSPSRQADAVRLQRSPLWQVLSPTGRLTNSSTADHSPTRRLDNGGDSEDLIYTQPDLIVGHYLGGPEMGKSIGRRNELGMTTAEYAVGTVGACGFGGLLYELLTSDWAQSLLRSIFEKALSIF